MARERRFLRTALLGEFRQSLRQPGRHRQHAGRLQHLPEGDHPLLAALASFGVGTIALLAIFTTYITRPFNGLLIPILGFIFAPYTLLAYCFARNAHGAVDGWYLALVIVAVLFDLGVLGGGARSRKVIVERRR